MQGDIVMLELENRKAFIVRGIGAFTSIGCSWIDFWESLKAGKSGIVRIQDLDPTGHKSQIASEIQCYNHEINMKGYGQ